MSNVNSYQVNDRAGIRHAGNIKKSDIPELPNGNSRKDADAKILIDQQRREVYLLTIRKSRITGLIYNV